MADIDTQRIDETSALSTTDASAAVPSTNKESAPRPKNFTDLPALVKETIIDFVTRPSDLKNVCLASKELHQLAVRTLYRHVSLDLGCANDCRLSAFLNPRNIGLKHIRQIRLYLAKVADACNQEQQATFATRMLLEFLPENILEEFRCVGDCERIYDTDDGSWCPWRPFSADNLLLLYKKQKKMKWLEVMDLDRGVLAELKADTLVNSGIFESARKLALYPENIATLDTAGHYIQKAQERLDELIIHANFTPPEDGEISARDTLDPRELNDTAIAPGLITRTLFSGQVPFDKCQPLPCLTSLRLHRMNLRYASDTWCKVINFTQIKRLRLYHCPGADSMFGQLCKSANLPAKLQTLELHHRDNIDNEALMALDGFLCLVIGLREINIDIHNVKSLPDTAGICKQSKTLEVLNVHASNESGSGLPARLEVTDADELVYSGEQMEKICKACTKLTQLSCAWPSTSLIRAKSDEWKHFEMAVTTNLKQLITLHISTWPNNKPSGQLLPRQVYEQLLQGLATRLLELSHSSRAVTTDVANDVVATASSLLRLVAFGIHDKIYEREDSISQATFLRSSALDAEGKQKIYATPIGWCLRQFIEPRSDVLETVLGRESRPPVKSDGRDFAIDEDGWDDD